MIKMDGVDVELGRREWDPQVVINTWYCPYGWRGPMEHVLSLKQMGFDLRSPTGRPGCHGYSSLLSYVNFTTLFFLPQPNFHYFLPNYYYLWGQILFFYFLFFGWKLLTNRKDVESWESLGEILLKEEGKIKEEKKKEERTPHVHKLWSN